MTPRDPETPVQSTGGGKRALAVVLAITISLGLAVRLIGIRHGEPDKLFHPDVEKQVRAAASLYASDSSLRETFGGRDDWTLYPYGTAVLVGYLSRIVSPGDPSLASDADASLWAWALRMRYFSVFLALLGTAFVLCAMFGELGWPASLLTGLLLALEPLNVQYSHYAMNDVPLVCLLLLSWLAARRMGGERGSLPLYSILTGFLLGVGFGVKYQAILGVVFPAVFWLSNFRKRSAGWQAASALALAAGFTGGALLTCPLLTQDPGYFLSRLPEFMRWQSNITGHALPFSEKVPRNLLGLIVCARGAWNWPLLAGFIGSVAVSWPRWRRGDDLDRLSAALFCALLLGVVVAFRDFVRENDMLPPLAFLIILSGDLVSRLERRAAPGRAWKAFLRLAWALGLVLVAIYGTIAVRDSLALARPDTRILAQRWCQANIPQGSAVIREMYTWPIGRPDIKERDIRFLLTNGWRQVSEGGADYLISSSLAYGRFFDPILPTYDEHTAGRLARLEERYTPVARFTDRKLLFAQPDITIWKRKPG